MKDVQNGIGWSRFSHTQGETDLSPTEEPRVYGLEIGDSLLTVDRPPP